MSVEMRGLLYVQKIDAKEALELDMSIRQVNTHADLQEQLAGEAVEEIM